MAGVAKYLVVREKKTDELRICRIDRHYQPPTADPEYTWGGPYPTMRSAAKAIEQMDADLHKQLYP
jgi:hypothetical protein